MVMRIIAFLLLAASTVAPAVELPVAALPGSVDYIVDGSSVNVPVGALELEWPAEAAEFAGRLQVEASEDRRTWRKAGDDAPIANLQIDGEKLLEQRVEFPPTQAKFWRLSWAGEAPSFQLTGVRVEPANGNAAIKRLKLAVNGRPVTARPGDFEFDLGAAVPVDRINVQLPAQNSLTRIELRSRTTSAQPWMPVITRGFYRLQTRNGELTNGPVAIASTPARYWLARLDEHSVEPSNGVPRLQVEWIAQSVPRRTPWVWIVSAVGLALLLVLSYRLLTRRERNQLDL